MNNLRTYYGADTIHKSMMQMYGWMIIGLIVTAATSILMIVTGLYATIIMNAPFLVIGLLIAELALVFVFTLRIQTLSVNQLKGIFIAYAFTLGFSLTPLAAIYNFGTIGIAFLVSTTLFISLAIIGMTTKRDLTGIGTICLAGLIALIISEVILMIVGANSNTRLLSIIGLLIFTGLSAWDAQRANQLLIMSDGQPVMQQKLSIYMALQLYLDFINLFLRILSIVGRKNN